MTRRKRQYRAAQRERYRSSVFITEYTRKKYRSIYEEANNFYQKLSKQYPTKTKVTTCPEFKAWEATLQKDYEPATLQKDYEPATLQKDYEPATLQKDYEPATLQKDYEPAENTIQLSIPLMNPAEIQEIQTSLVFQDIYPSLLEEINPETVNQIMNEIRESDDVDEIVSEIMNEIRESDDVDEIVSEIISEIEETNANLFNCSDEDMNDMIEAEINNSLSQLDQLEKELLKC